MRPFTTMRPVCKIMDYVRCCRKRSLVQKQLLLPMFLAGSEVAEHEMRLFVREYCEWWKEQSRYNMFSSVLTLLEQIWQENDSAPYMEWWGSKTTCRGQDSLQFLFG